MMQNQLPFEIVNIIHEFNPACVAISPDAKSFVGITVEEIIQLDHTVWFKYAMQFQYIDEKTFEFENAIMSINHTFNDAHNFKKYSCSMCRLAIKHDAYNCFNMLINADCRLHQKCFNEAIILHEQLIKCGSTNRILTRSVHYINQLATVKCPIILEDLFF